MILFRRDAAPYHTPTRAQAVYDVSGAGDTAIGVFTLGLAAGATPEEAAELANHASGIVVGKVGTATATREELLASFTPYERTAGGVLRPGRHPDGRGEILLRSGGRARVPGSDRAPCGS